MKRLLLLLGLLSIVGCRAREPDFSKGCIEENAPCIEADVRIDGALQHFSEPAYVDLLIPAEPSITARAANGVAIAIQWLPSKIAVGQPLEADRQGVFRATVGFRRQGMQTYASPSGGRAVFEKADPDGTPSIATFDALEAKADRDGKPVSVTLVGGRFRTW